MFSEMKVAKAKNEVFCVLSILTGLENVWFALSEMRKRMRISVVEKGQENEFEPAR